ncbi:MAG TPA: hypothetical protein VLN59_09960 [Burkholderiales bacterium]|nr:hypothetical protein [Burkholderiales bacterium]
MTTVSYHHRALPLGEWEHRTYWHTHEHNYSELLHIHDYDLTSEEDGHAKEAHTHDHAVPHHSPALIDPVTPRIHRSSVARALSPRHVFLPGQTRRSNCEEGGGVNVAGLLQLSLFTAQQEGD